MPRESGASSFPETPVVELMGRGVLDRPVKPGDDIGNQRLACDQFATMPIPRREAATTRQLAHGISAGAVAIGLSNCTSFQSCGCRFSSNPALRATAIMVPLLRK